MAREEKIDSLLFIAIGMAVLTAQSIRFIPLLAVALVPDAHTVFQNSVRTFKDM